MSLTMTIEVSVPCVPAGRCGRKELRPEGERAVLPPGRVPRVARLLALAHRFHELLRGGAVKDFAELARLGRVTRARISQVMNLLNLAPAIQEEILFLARTEHGRDAIILADLQPIASVMSWPEQRRMWAQLVVAAGR